MDSATGARFLDQIMLNTNQHIQGALISTDNMSLDQAQSQLLTNAITKGGRTQYFTDEELELFAVNPPLEPGHINIPNILVNDGFHGNKFVLYDIHSNATILYLHKLIEEKTGIPIPYQRLSLSNCYQDYFSTVAECKLKDGSEIHLLGRLLSGPGLPSSGPPTNLLDDRYHLDLTNLTTDDDQTFYRGGSVYNRPCGWMRFALKMDGEYNPWLDGRRSSPRVDETSSADEEWAVSYHGTGRHNGLSIASEGYKLLLSKGVRFPVGSGTFSTPDIAVAQLYAETFDLGGVSYMAVVQNRVNPKTVIKILKEENGVNGEYWISPTKEDIRPYGFCVRKVE